MLRSEVTVPGVRVAEHLGSFADVGPGRVAGQLAEDSVRRADPLLVDVLGRGQGLREQVDAAFRVVLCEAEEARDRLAQQSR